MRNKAAALLLALVMAYYRTCEHCGANLDPGESCDCDKKETALGVSSTQGGMVEQVLTDTVSASIIRIEGMEVKYEVF